MNSLLATAIVYTTPVEVPPVFAVPDFQPITPPGAETVTTIVGWVLWAVAILCFVGLIFVAARLAAAPASQHGGHGVGKGLAYVLGACMIVSSAGAIIATVLT